MKWVVGTLYSGEREVAPCLRSLSKQEGEIVQQVLVQGYSHRRAHDELYRAFENRTERADYFLKLDADMVLRDSNFLGSLAEYLRGRPDIRNLEVAVDDFFTGRPVWGIHAYTAEVTWGPRGELFVDRRPVQPPEHHYEADRFAGDVAHAPDPFPAQGLMHGLKRGVKFLELTNVNGTGLAWFGRKVAQRVSDWFADGGSPVNPGRDDNRVLGDLWAAQRAVNRRFEETGDVRIGLSCLGFERGLSGSVPAESLSYASAEFQGLLKQFVDRSADELAECIRRTRRRNFGVLPGFLRKRLLRFLYQAGMR